MLVKDGMPAGRMGLALWVALLLAALKLCRAQNPTCNGTALDADKTMYNISGLPHVFDVKASRCQYSWTSDRVLATHLGSTSEVVKSNSINTLIMSACFDEIVYTRSCISEVEGYTINCTTNCGANAPFQNDKEISRTRGAAVAAFVAFVFIILVLVALKVQRHNSQDV